MRMSIPLAAVIVSAVGAPRIAAQTWQDRVLVKLEAADPAVAPRQHWSIPTGIAALDAELARFGASEIRPIFVRPPRGRADELLAAELGLDRWHVVRFPSEHADIGEIAAILAALPDIELAELDSRIEPLVVPNDPDYAPFQWDLKPDRTDAESAWNLKTDSSDVIVCVIDTGCETSHPDIQANLWVNPGEIPGNNVDDEGNGYVDDVHGFNFSRHNGNVEDQWPHGIHVNGIIGAVGNNALQVTGVNWGARLMQAKIFDSGADAWTAAAEANVYAADNGAKVTNNSWGGSRGPQAYVDSMKYANQLDVLQVAAAGNTGSTGKFWPAAYRLMMAISSTNPADQLSGFSTHGDWINMSAPGEDIYNLWVNGSTTYLSGTSMASPHVAGAAALIRSLNPQLTAREAWLVLQLHGDDLGSPGFDNSFGYGRLDIGQAAVAAQSLHLEQLSTSAPDTVDIDLDLPAEANRMYVLLASPAGMEPGIDLRVFDPADARILPLNNDPFLTFLLLVQPNPIGDRFIGFLDGAGHADAAFVIPGGPYFKGHSFSFCGVTFDPADLTHVGAISAPLTLNIDP